MNIYSYNNILLLLFGNLPIVFCQFLGYDVVKHYKDLLNTNRLSQECRKTLNLFVDQLNQRYIPGEDIWALQMLDAIPKTAVGLLSFNMAQLGDFDQCTSIYSQKYNIIGKYCLGKISINSSAISEYGRNHLYLKTLTSKATVEIQEVRKSAWATCLPSNCTYNDVIEIMNMTETFGISISSVVCQSIDEISPKLDRAAIIGISIFSFLFTSTIISTLLDIYSVYIRKEKIKPIYKSFSVYTHGKNLLSCPNRRFNLSCLDGMRVLSILWILLFHVSHSFITIPLVNHVDIIDFLDSTYSMMFVHGDLATDTFLLIGGTLVTYLYLRKEKQQKMTVFGVFKYYLHRYIRLTPTLAVVVLFHVTLIRYTGSGPIWDSIEDSCKRNWWQVLLYTQNLMNHERMCMIQSWYVNVDMQLYIFSPFIYSLLSFNSKVGIGALTIATICSIAISFYKGYTYEMCALKYDKRSSYDLYQSKFYLHTETRAATWLLGTILGFLLAQRKYTNVRLPKKLTAFLWTITISVAAICVFGGHDIFRCRNPNRIKRALYISFNRPIFAMAIGWMIWACATNHGGIINNFLSHPVFKYLNKFTYSFYLIHFSYLTVLFASTKTALYFSVFDMILCCCKAVFIVFGFSIICVLLIETPAVELERIIIGNPKEHL